MQSDSLSRDQYLKEKYAPFYGAPDPSWDAKEISPYALAFRDEAIAGQIEQDLFWHSTDDLKSKDEAPTEDAEFAGYLAKKAALIKTVRNLLFISADEDEFDINNYPRNALPTLTELVLRGNDLRYEEGISNEELKKLYLKVLSDVQIGPEFITSVFRGLDPGSETEHLRNILQFQTEIVLAFLRLAKVRLTTAQASYLAEKVIKKQMFEVAIFLTETFPGLNERYSISVVGRGTVSTIDEIFTELSKYIDGKRTVINCLLDSVADPVEMIRSGLLPHPDIETISLEEEKEDGYDSALLSEPDSETISLEEKDKYESSFDIAIVLSLLAENVPLDQIEWWTKLENVTNALQRVKLWSFYTKEGAKNEAKRGNSYASLFADFRSNRV